jgi:ABC-type transport system involved in multi-copper enzyme maturation permease subunit
MLRSILGAIAGYIVMVLVIFLTFSAAYLVMGADVAFGPAGYDVSLTWIVVSFVFGFIAAVVGGYLSAVIGRSGTAVKILAGLVLVLGIVSAIMVSISPRSTDTRTAATPNLEAMSKARTPLWVALLNPLIGLAGVLVGGGMRKEKA